MTKSQRQKFELLVDKNEDHEKSILEEKIYKNDMSY